VAGRNRQIESKLIGIRTSDLPACMYVYIYIYIFRLHRRVLNSESKDW
jgi:hypothetical protein